MNSEVLLEFKKLFDQNVYSEIEWQTEKAGNIWDDTIIIQESIIGPLFSIYQGGNCEYVYTGSNKYFKNIKNTESLKILLLEWLSEMEKIVKQFELKSIEEENDFKIMKERLKGYRELIDMLYILEQKERN